MISLLLLATALADDPQEIALANGGFEDGGYEVSDPGGKVGGTIGKGWGDNSAWADVSVAYALEKTNPRRGAACQRVTLRRIGSGAVQFTQGVRFKRGRAYAWTVWMRGRPGTSVALILRKQGEPYTHYAVSDVVLLPEWREYTVEGPVSEDADGLLMLRMTAPGELFLDDARLTDLTDATANAAPRTGNLLAGGSFEAGMPFGWSTRIGGAASPDLLDPRPAIDETAAVDGLRSYRLDLPAGMDAEIRGPLLRPNIGREHAISVWMKAVPDAYVDVELERTPLTVGVGIGREWKRVALKGVMPYQRWTRFRVRARAPGGAVRLWMDGAQVEEAGQPSTAYVPRAPHEVVLRLDKPGSIVFEDAEALLAVVPPAPEGARLRLRMTDVDGVAKDLPPLTLPATRVPLPSTPRGVFKLAAEVESKDGKSLSAPVELVWSRLPRPREIEPSSSYFGLHMPIEPAYVAMARASGHRWTRVHDTSMFTKWPVTETAPGAWRFFDRHADAARDGGMAVLGMLDGAPLWVSTKKREGGYWGIWHLPDRPEAAKAWDTYVRTVVGHYRGRIDAWEVWNEPWGDWFSGNGGTPKLYAELLRTAYEAAKAANPKCVVVGVDTYRGHDAWHDGVLAAAKLDAFDAFSFHDYNDALYGGPTSMARVQADAFNAAQAKHGAPKPLWNTEGGALALASMYAPETGGMPLRAQLAQGVRYDVTMMAAGVRMFCFYAAHADPGMGHPEGALEWDRAIKPLLAGRAVLASLVDGLGAPVRSEPAAGVDLHAYPPRDGQIVQVLWSHDGDPHTVEIPAKARVLDVFGNPVAVEGRVTVTVEPVYFILSR
jgi:hypothetical protein